MGIYTPDVAFVDDVTAPGSPHVVHGVDAYQRQLWSLRLHSALFCSSIGMQVLRMWQPRERCISVRWSIKATPRLIGSLIERPYYFGALRVQARRRGPDLRAPRHAAGLGPQDVQPAGHPAQERVRRRRRADDALLGFAPCIPK